MKRLALLIAANIFASHAMAAKSCEELGAGEILLNCIDKDGTNSGFDLELINAVKNAVSIPVIASSGAGNAEHFLDDRSIRHERELSRGGLRRLHLRRLLRIDFGGSETRGSLGPGRGPATAP